MTRFKKKKKKYFVPASAPEPPEPKEKKPTFTTKGDSEKITIKKSTYNNILKGVIVAIAIVTIVGVYSLVNMDDSGSGITDEELKVIVQELDNKLTQAPTSTALPSAPSAVPKRIPGGSGLISVSADDDPFKGNADAPVTIVEFSDFQCPFCKRFVDNTLASIEEKYINTGKVKFVFRDFPLTSIHPNVGATHIAAECANEQGKFWEYHDTLFENVDKWKVLSPSDLNSQLNEYATTLGLQSSSFESCLSSEEMAAEVDSDFLQAGIYGATGTPTFFVGNEEDGFVKLAGAQPFIAFKSEIDKHFSYHYT